MSSINVSTPNLDGPSAQLAIVGAKISQQSAATTASVVEQALSATAQIASAAGSGAKPSAGSGNGAHIDTYA